MAQWLLRLAADRRRGGGLRRLAAAVPVDQPPLSTVGAIEFLGTAVLVAPGARTRRNLLALVLAVDGVAALTEVRLGDEPLGVVFAPLRSRWLGLTSSALPR